MLYVYDFISSFYSHNHSFKNVPMIKKRFNLVIRIVASLFILKLNNSILKFDLRNCLIGK